jgi:small subunit ribosomal protein S6
MEALSRYELLMLATPEITQDETKELEKQLGTLIKARKGSVIAFDRWGKYRLAYPIKKAEYGVYFLLRFDVQDAQNLNHEIHSLLRVRFDNIVIREVLTALDLHAPLDYKRPRSLEDAPSSEEGSVLKGKKGEGMLSAADNDEFDGMHA